MCWFCILPLNWIHSLVLTVFLESFEFSLYGIMSSADSDSFASSFIMQDLRVRSLLWSTDPSLLRKKFCILRPCLIVEHNTYGGVLFGKVGSLPLLPISVLSFLSFVVEALFIQFVGLFVRKLLLYICWIHGKEWVPSSYATILNPTAPSLIFMFFLPSYKVKKLRYSCCARCLKGQMSLLMDYTLNHGTLADSSSWE